MSTEASEGPLRSIHALLKYKYFIPSYQRGYRWTKEQVNDLLDDILEFHVQNDGKKEFYCLQPIVVYPREGYENEFVVIDGQQRLTTILIILNALRPAMEANFPNKQPFQIEYETRPGSSKFLNNINEDEKDDYIDYHHIYEAKQTVEKWFKDNDEKISIGTFLNTILNPTKPNVQVIWYQPDKSENHIDVFTRLNMGKIGLTNSELIKALFMSQYQTMTEDEERELPRKQKEIAAEWDRYENHLRDKQFWGFIQNGTIQYDNHIELLFDLIADNLDADGKRKSTDEFQTFRYFLSAIKNKDGRNSAKKAWKIWDEEVKAKFHLLHDWFSDKKLYHLIGYLITTGEPLSKLIADFSQLSKSQLEVEIRKKIKSGGTDFSNLEDLTYLDDKQDIRNTLLLFNILSIINSPNDDIKFQFGRYKGEGDEPEGKWDIEHIHSVNSRIPEGKNDQRDWLKVIRNFLEGKKVDKKLKPILADIDQVLDTEIKEKPDFEDLYSRILKAYSENEEPLEINDISNLTLLDASTNRMYKNAVFPIKRKTIIDRDQQGVFIPICTKNVFLKYYNPDPKQTSFWGKEDMRSYKKSLISTVSNYLNPSES